jgi:hypothetical protein
MTDIKHTHPLFKGGLGQFDGIPDAEVQRISAQMNGMLARYGAMRMLELQRDKYQALADAAPEGSAARRAAQVTANETQINIDWYISVEIAIFNDVRAAHDAVRKLPRLDQADQVRQN